MYISIKLTCKQHQTLFRKQILQPTSELITPYHFSANTSALLSSDSWKRFGSLVAKIPSTYTAALKKVEEKWYQNREDVDFNAKENHQKINSPFYFLNFNIGISKRLIREDPNCIFMNQKMIYGVCCSAGTIFLTFYFTVQILMAHR